MIKLSGDRMGKSKLQTFIEQWLYSVNGPNPGEKVYDVNEVMGLLEAAWDISQAEPFASYNPFTLPSDVRSFVKGQTGNGTE